MLVPPPGGLAPPPTGNPGSAPACDHCYRPKGNVFTSVCHSVHRGGGGGVCLWVQDGSSGQTTPPPLARHPLPRQTPPPPRDDHYSGRYASYAYPTHEELVAAVHSKILYCPPWGSKFFQFHAVFGKIWQNRMLAPAGGLAPPTRGNTTGYT